MYIKKTYSDQNRVRTLLTKLSRLYHRIIKTHENIDSMLESIRIWGKVPLYQCREGNATSLVDIDDRSLKCKTRCVEVNNSKKLIEYTMEENYRLLFGMPLLERKKEFGKDRLRNTIIQKFGRHQAKDKFGRMSSVVRYVFFLLLYHYFLRFKFIEPNFFHLYTPLSFIHSHFNLTRHFNLFIQFYFKSNFQVELLHIDAVANVSEQSEKIVKSEDNLKLFRPYEEYVDKLISQALLSGVESRSVYSVHHYLCLAPSPCVFCDLFF